MENSEGQLMSEDSGEERLAEAEQEWEKLTNTLSSLLGWIEDKSIEMLEQQPVGGSLTAVMAQSTWMKNMEKEMEQKFADWDRAIHAAALRLQELERALAECQLHLSSVESEVEQLRPVERLRLEELKDARRQCESLANRVADLRIHVDDANDACGRVLAADTPLDQHPRNQLDSVNERLVFKLT
nr:Protein DYS-1, isoform a [Haemonchus contortus]